ncbi:MAG: hypothetical protein ACOCWO_05760, partial [Candidatus Muiribacteriaceae bacterium]
LFLFIFSILLFISSRMEHYRKEFSYLIANGIGRQSLIRDFYITCTLFFVVLFILSSFSAWLLIICADGMIAIPSEVYSVDRLYLDFDTEYYILFSAVFIGFMAIQYFFFYSFFQSLDLDEELRSS